MRGCPDGACRRQAPPVVTARSRSDRPLPGGGFRPDCRIWPRLLRGYAVMWMVVQRPESARRNRQAAESTTAAANGICDGVNHGNGVERAKATEGRARVG